MAVYIAAWIHIDTIMSGSKQWPIFTGYYRQPRNHYRRLGHLFLYAIIGADTSFCGIVFSPCHKLRISLCVCTASNRASKLCCNQCSATEINSDITSNRQLYLTWIDSNDRHISQIVVAKWYRFYINQCISVFSFISVAGNEILHRCTHRCSIYCESGASCYTQNRSSQCHGNYASGLSALLACHEIVRSNFISYRVDCQLRGFQIRNAVLLYISLDIIGYPRQQISRRTYDKLPYYGAYLCYCIRSSLRQYINSNLLGILKSSFRRFNVISHLTVLVSLFHPARPVYRL